MTYSKRVAKWIQAIFFIAVWPWRRVPMRQISDEHLESAAKSLDEKHLEDIGRDGISLAKLLMEENRRICEAKIASVRALEGKAIGQVGVAGTILALFAAFGRDVAFGWKAIPLVMLVVAIISYLKAAYVRSGALPSFGLFLSKNVIANPLNEGKIAVLAAGAWHDYGLEIEQSNNIKAQFVRTGNFWLQLGLIGILVVVFFTGSPNKSIERTTRTSGVVRSGDLHNVQRHIKSDASGRRPIHRIDAAPRSHAGRRQTASAAVSRTESTA